VHKRVVLVDPLPEFYFPAPEALGLEKARGLLLDFGIPKDQYLSMNARAITMLDGIAAKYHLTKIPSARLLCDARRCRAFDGKDVLYFDELHLSMSGARRLAGLTAPSL
jgi:hypothetical protein